MPDLDEVHPRQYPLPRLVQVTWRRGNRREHAVGFLIANNGTHLVLCDQFDGKHPDRRRLWTIDVGDVVEEQSLYTFAELDFVVGNAAVEATTRFMERALEGEGGTGQEYEGLMNDALRTAEAGNVAAQ